MKIDYCKVNKEEKEDDNGITGGGSSLPAGEKARYRHCLGSKVEVGRSEILVFRF